MHSKISNLKHQIPIKSQTPIFNDQNTFGILNFSHCDLFGIFSCPKTPAYFSLLPAVGCLLLFIDSHSYIPESCRRRTMACMGNL